jgi:hypothetical protein
MESAIELFAIFGGLDITIDVTKHKHELIRTIILENYHTLNRYINELLEYNKSAIRLLRALSVGDRRIFSSFKKARLNNINGGIALHFLQEQGLLSIEYSREQDKRQIKPKLSKEEARHRISDKFLFTYPFIRFWFYFIYPYAKQVEQGDFKVVLQKFEEQKHSYTSLVFEELSRLLLNYHLRDVLIETIGSYWDANVEIDVLVVTKTQQSYVAESKWTNHKINKKELNKLIEKCEMIHIYPLQYIFFSKRGFSKELISMEGKTLALFSVEDFQWLIKTKPSSMVFPLSVPF